MANLKVSEADKRTETITVKCSKEEKDRLLLTSVKRGKSLSTYMLETGLSGSLRGRYKDKIMIGKLVNLQDLINHLNRHLDENNLPDDVISDIQTLKEGIEKLWED